MRSVTRLTHPCLRKSSGENLNILETTFKLYPCCKALHSAIDGMLELNSEHHFDPEQAREVVGGGYEKLAKMHDIYEPATSMAAQFSIPYVVATALLKGRPGVETFDERNISDRTVLAFARKVKVMVDPEVTPYFPAHEPSKVTVNLLDGSSYSKTIICSKGTPNNPMSNEELEAKFTTFALQVIPARQAERAVESIRNLDKMARARELSLLLCKTEA
jgi:2-methylcitrate dehydratase PrpD